MDPTVVVAAVISGDMILESLGGVCGGVSGVSILMTFPARPGLTMISGVAGVCCMDCNRSSDGRLLSATSPISMGTRSDKMLSGSGNWKYAKSILNWKF